MFLVQSPGLEWDWFWFIDKTDAPRMQAYIQKEEGSFMSDDLLKWLYLRSFLLWSERGFKDLAKVHWLSGLRNQELGVADWSQFTWGKQ